MHVEGHQHTPAMRAEHSLKEIAKFIAVLIGIVLAAHYLTYLYGPDTFLGWSRWFMGVFFLIFGLFKIAGYKMFVMMFAGYDVIAKRFMPYAHAYPLIELGLAFLYLQNIAPQVRDVLALVIMAVSSIGVFQEIRKRSGVHCACLGNIIKLPLSTVSLVENVGMAVMALVVILLR